MPKKQTYQPASSSEQTDLWEHACLLFHNLEWQDAAKSFNYLRHMTADLESQALCLLNEGMILARLGDNLPARQVFEDALRLSQQEPITHFLLGLVEAEIGDAVRSLSRFEMCSERLGAGELDYRARRLDFTLTSNAVRNNAAAMWARVQSLNGLTQAIMAPAALERIPAGVLFEASPRFNLDLAYGRSSGQIRLSRSLSKMLSSTGTDSDATLIPARPEHASMSLSQNTLRPSVETSRSLKSLILRTKAPESPKLDHVTSLPDLGALCINGGANKLRRNFIARDARVQDESTRELASFLKHAGPGSNKDVTIDRDYMLRLLQNDISRASTVPWAGLLAEAPETDGDLVYRESTRRDIDSVLDLYANYTSTIRNEEATTPADLLNIAGRSPAFQPPSPHPRPRTQYGLSSPLHPQVAPVLWDPPPGNQLGLFPPLRPQPQPVRSPESIVRRPVPYGINEITLGDPSNNRALQPDPHPGTQVSIPPLAPENSMSPTRRHAALATAGRWLRKEVRPPWAGAGGGQRLSVGTKPLQDRTPSGGSEERSTVLSTVASVDILGLGKKVRRYGALPRREWMG